MGPLALDFPPPDLPPPVGSLDFPPPPVSADFPPPEFPLPPHRLIPFPAVLHLPSPPLLLLLLPPPPQHLERKSLPHPSPPPLRLSEAACLKGCEGYEQKGDAAHDTMHNEPVWSISPVLPCSGYNSEPDGVGGERQ